MGIGKSLERAYRARILKRLQRDLRRDRPMPIPIPLPENARLLIIRPEKLGDAYITLPLIHALRAQRPDLSIEWVASPRQLPLLSGEPAIDKVHLYNKRHRRERAKLLPLADQPWAAVLDLIYGDSATGLALCGKLAPHAPRLAAHKNDLTDCYDYVFTDSREIPAAETALGLLRPLGLDAAADSLPRLTFSHGERARATQVAAEMNMGREALIVNISVGKPTRLWPDEKFVSVLDDLSRLFTMRVILCTPADRPRAVQIAKAANGHVEIVPRDLDIRSAAALLAQAALVITPDTVIAHLAASVTATVALYPGVEWNFNRWRAQGPRVTCLRASHPDEIADIPVVAVTDAAKQLRDPAAVAQR